MATASIADTGGQFATGVNNTSGTGGKFATGVVDNGGAPWLANISVNFRKKFEMTLMLFSGASGKVMKQKFSWHCPFKASVQREVRFV